MEIETAPLFVSKMSGQIYVKARGQAQTSGPVVSVLTYPTKDYAGDIVKPDGGDWSKYPEHPYVNWSHRCPVGRGTVKHQVLKYDGKFCPVAVGETLFFQNKADLEGIDLRRRDPRTHRAWDKEPPYTVDEVLKAAAQAERLVRDDIANGVSIEFDVDQKKKGTDWWDLAEKSLLENRPARHFEVWRGLGYAHARQPVNPGCLTAAGQPRMTPNVAAIEKAIQIVQTGKLPGGEVACEIIIKAFDDLRHYKPGYTTIVVKGDVPSGDGDGFGSTESTDPNNTDDPNKPKMGAGQRAMMNFVQGLMDCCKRLEEEGSLSDDLSIRKYCKKVCEKVKNGIAGEVKARAEKHKARLDGAGGDEDPMDEDDYEPSAEEKAIELDDKGVIVTKAFPEWKPVRMKLENIVPVTTPAQTVQTPAVETVSPEQEAAALKRMRRAIKKVQPYLDAAAANGLL